MSVKEQQLTHLQRAGRETEPRALAVEEDQRQRQVRLARGRVQNWKSRVCLCGVPAVVVLHSISTHLAHWL